LYRVFCSRGIQRPQKNQKRGSGQDSRQKLAVNRRLGGGLVKTQRKRREKVKANRSPEGPKKGNRKEPLHLDHEKSKRNLGASRGRRDKKGKTL